MLKCNEESKKNERWQRKVWKGKKKRQKKIMSDKSKVSKKVEKKKCIKKERKPSLKNVSEECSSENKVDWKKDNVGVAQSIEYGCFRLDCR